MKSFYTLFLSFILILAFSVVYTPVAQPVFAGSESPLSDGLDEFGGAGSGLRTDGSLIGFVSQIISWGLGLVGTVFFVIILINGFKYMTAGGNASASQESVKAITNAVIGLVIIMGAFLITNYVTSALLSA